MLSQSEARLDVTLEPAAWEAVLAGATYAVAEPADPAVPSEASQHRLRTVLETLARSAAEPGGEPVEVPGAPAARAEPGWGECVVRRLLAVVDQDPTAVALVAGERTLTYGDLAARVGGVAEQVTGTARVAVLAGHGEDAVVGVLAALAAGAAYVPLDPRLPDGRLRRILRQVRPDVVLHEPALRERAEALLPRRARAVALEPVTGVLRAPAAGAELAYVLFTSGTTGAPKGVLQSVAGLVRHARAYRDSVGLTAGETVPLLASLAFDAAVMDLYGALLTGASVHLVDPVQGAPELRRALAARPPAVLHATPTLVRHLLTGLDGPWPELATVRAVVLGGERVRPEDVAALQRALPAAYVVNGLGPSECTLGLQHVVAPGTHPGAVVPVGRAVPGITAEVLGPDGGAGAPAGELALTGAAVALGYLDQDELTARQFTDHGDGTRTYRTGDRVWRRPDGALVHLGRADRQLKVRGQRIEPEEVETVLQAHPTVAEAAVVLDDEERLVAYVTASTAFLPEADDVLRYAARQLPAAALPARVVVVAALPIGPTGKRDLAALPGLPDLAERTAAGFTAEQQRVARIWADLLGHERFGASDDFLLVGGDSLLMMRLSLALEQEYDVALDLVDVMTGCTVAELAALCERATPEERTR